MKKVFTSLFMILWISVGVMYAQDVTITDSKFKAYLVEKFDTSKDGEIQVSEAEVAIDSMNIREMGITDLTGIEAFVNIKKLYCDNNKIMTLDVSKNTALEVLSCNFTGITSLDISNNVLLTSLTCTENEIITLDITKNSALVELYCGFNNSLTELKMANNNALIKIYCDYVQSPLIDFSQAPSLKILSVYYTQLTNLDVSNNLDLTELDCSYSELTNLDISSNLTLTKVNCSNNKLTNLDLSNNAALIELNCSNNKLINLDVTKNESLLKLSCIENSELSTICVHSIANVINGEFYKDLNAIWSEKCVITSLTDSERVTNLKIVKAYNLQGKEININTKNELIILLYENGITEKVFRD